MSDSLQKTSLDRDLVEKAAKDPEAFGQLYDLYFPRIFRFIYHRTGQTAIAQDLTAETFFKALKNIWRYKFTGKPFSAWLYKIAIAQTANFYRRKNNYCEISLEEAPAIINSQKTAGQPNADYEKIETFREIHAALQKIKPIQHTILVLKYFEDKSLQDIGQILGQNINTIKSHQRRGLIALRQIINPQHNGTKFLNGQFEKTPAPSSVRTDE